LSKQEYLDYETSEHNISIKKIIYSLFLFWRYWLNFSCWGHHVEAKSHQLILIFFFKFAKAFHINQIMMPSKFSFFLNLVILKTWQIYTRKRKKIQKLPSFFLVEKLPKVFFLLKVIKPKQCLYFQFCDIALATIIHKHI
jgi:hypothetical protein